MSTNSLPGPILHYHERVAWTAALVGIPAWIAHLTFEAAMVQFTTHNPRWEWTLHAATIATALVTVAGMALCLDLLRRARLAREEGDDDASASSITAFLGGLGLLVGASNLALILMEGSYVIFVHRRG